MIGNLLTHTVSIVRATYGGTDDEYGQPTRSESTVSAKAAIQPKTDHEIALTTQGGAVVSDHRIFLLPTDIDTADAIIHEAQDCPMRPDLPDARYEVTAVPNAAGLGHHLEVEAKIIGGIAVAGS